MNIYVGNLSYDATENDLKELFSPFGNVLDAKVIMNKNTNQSKGFGFVTLDNNTSGQEAIDKLNETEWQGRKIRVNQAKEQS